MSTSSNAGASRGGETLAEPIAPLLFPFAGETGQGPSVVDDLTGGLGLAAVLIFLIPVVLLTIFERVLPTFAHLGKPKSSTEG